MYSLINFFLALAAGLSMVRASSGNLHFYNSFVKRNSTNDLQGFKGAILLKNGEQTTCEIALMRSTYGAVSASCLDYTDDNDQSVDTSTNYEVAISAGLVGTYGTFKVAKLTPHPHYDPSSYANNIAVIQFDNGGRGDFINFIASWRPDWKTLYYVRRTMFDVAKAGWNTPVTTVYNSTVDSGDCARASDVFASNQNSFFCNQLSTPSIYNSTCAVPYGSIYGEVSPNLAIAALHSHSASTVATGFVGRPRYSTITPPEYKEITDSNYSMVIPSRIDTEKVGVYGGDIYTVKRKAETPTISQLIETQVDNTESLPPTSVPSMVPASTKTQSKPVLAVVILAVVASVIAGLGLVVWLILRKMRRKNIAKTSRARWWWLSDRSKINSDNINMYSRRPLSIVSFPPPTHSRSESIMDLSYLHKTNYYH
ncbi:hypothetical protein BX661DRAFT_186567 [Kickxella alabastrina]|uniref:uncharacterized protein n=1 Tax=Kickxella alabastrina TaxID=61397 RepID=UPI00221EBD00|nr:uncharacterized protein BX661DRAFT_186567 [Kickxella alabastrina]KAI7823422.1 hypothetical protein BX661DRAFT_186567 [Kickxella alabastrina]